MENNSQDRKARLKAIRTIVATGKIDRQEQLAAELLKKGFSTTQTTLSRDLNYLRISKVRSRQGGAVYALPREGSFQPVQTEEDIKKSKWQLFISRNIAVLHTPPGHAGIVAIEIDELKSPYILGTVAGDDTVLIVLAEDREKEGFNVIREMFPQLK